jgi:hypothetical protein
LRLRTGQAGSGSLGLCRMRRSGPLSTQRSTMTGSIFESPRHRLDRVPLLPLSPASRGICSSTAVDGRALTPCRKDSFFNPANTLTVSAFCSTQKGGSSTPACGRVTVGLHGPVFGRKHTVLSMARHIQVNRDWCPAIVPLAGPAQLLLPGDQKHSPNGSALCET